MCRQRASPMCGNSICQDRRFLYKYMPRLAEFFHYRNLDVSTLKELATRWAPGMPAFTKESSHLALDDIRDSIAELRYYRNIFCGSDDLPVALYDTDAVRALDAAAIATDGVSG